MDEILNKQMQTLFKFNRRQFHYFLFSFKSLCAQATFLKNEIFIIQT